MQVAQFSSLNLVQLPLQVLILHGDVAVALDLHEDRQKAEAGIPHDDTFVAAFDDFRIHQGPWIFAWQAQKDDTLGRSDLRRGDAPSVASSLAPVRKRVFQVFHERANFRRRSIPHFAAGLAQDRVPELQHFPDGHNYSNAVLRSQTGFIIYQPATRLPKQA